MLVRSILTSGLSHLSYLLVSEGQAAVVDPRRDYQVYLELAELLDASISFILETHRNEDVVSGARALSNELDVPVYHGGNRDYGERVQEDEVISLEGMRVEVVETPGHTDDSLTFIAHDERGEVYAFTGDLLLPDETGRVDLVGDPDRNAELMYESLKKLSNLKDGTIVMPAHTSGSFCGISIGSREFSTMGIERARNRWLNLERSEFIAKKVEESVLMPPYFERVRELNSRGAGPPPEPIPVGPDEISEEKLDLRGAVPFAAAHIPGSVSMWMERLSYYGGWFVKPGATLIGEKGAPRDAHIMLGRVGVDDLSYLEGGFSSWYMDGREVRGVELVTPSKLMEMKGLTLVDVRSAEQRAEGYIHGSIHIPILELLDRLNEVPERVVVYCNKGNLSTLAASLLLREGFDVATLLGGITAWEAAGGEVERLSSGP